ncbi:MAG TPA: basic secretory protein-like protein [Polyangia bacterium]
MNRTEVQADGAGQSGNDGGARPEVRTDGLIDSGRSDAADGGAADTGAGLDAGIPVNPALEAVCTPQVTLTTPDATAAVFLDAMGGSRAGVEAIVQGIGRDVCRVLYRKPEEVRAANSVELVARDYAGVAAKSGDLGRIKVEISTRHLQSVKNAGGDVAREIKGILYHEMTHMYQQDDKPEGTWSGLPSYYEAGADAVRIRYGYLPNGCRPNKNGQWHQHNYCSGGYWWLWVDTKHPDFLYKLNLLMKGRDMKAFTPADATAITGTSLDDLWREYQTAACCSDSSTACCK